MNAWNSLTSEQTLKRLVAIQEIQTVMGRHVFYHLLGNHWEEIDAIWVKNPENRATASFAINYCMWSGMENIIEAYCRVNEESMKKNLEVANKYNPAVHQKFRLPIIPLVKRSNTNNSQHP